MYYSSQAGKKYDLAVVLNRAGVRWFWSFDDIAYRAESRYVLRYSAFGQTAEEALKLYGTTIQESRNWQSVAEDFLGQVNGFHELIAAARDDSMIKHPQIFWDDIVKPLFEEAYEPPVDLDAISRIYALADWCHMQLHEFDNIDLPSVMLVTFYEWIPTVTAALLDMPNWFTFEEIEDWIMDSPFLGASRQDLLRVYRQE